MQVKCRKEAVTITKIIYNKNDTKRKRKIIRIQGLKSTTTRECWRYNKQNKIWQRTYYEHIIRNEKEYLKIYKYIEENPIKWKYDIIERKKVMNEKNKSVEKAKKILEEIS